jgi:hypothetical protein
MARLIPFALATYCYLQPGLPLAQDKAKQLVGSWKLNSWTTQIIDGEVTTHSVPIRKAERSSRRLAFAFLAPGSVCDIGLR